jgi:uncharacterized DUF497 family protein
MEIRIKWTRKAEQHIAKHGLTKSQVDKAIEGRFVILRTRYNRYKILCKYEGRIIAVITEPYKSREFNMKGITARDADDKEKRLYKKKVK